MSALPVGLVTELIIRTVLIAAGTAAVLWLLRIRTASVRHAAWAAVVVAMLVLPLLLVARVRMSLPVLTPSAEITSTPSSEITPSTLPAVPEVSQAAEFQGGLVPPSAPTASLIDWRVLLLSGYIAGALLLLLRLGVGTFQANRLRRNAVVHEGRLTSDHCVTPITVGWLTPRLILPRGWDRWSPEQLTVVLTHEREHARRHDPLTQWLALLNRAVFWFHPLAWWLERHLATLAEEACDAAVLTAGHSPHAYSEYLLGMARTVSRQHGRVRLVGMAMPGAGLSGRLSLILKGLPTVRVSRVRLVCTIGFCAISSVIFAAGTLAERSGQQRSESPIKFEVVSIKPCPPLPPEASGRGGSSGHQTTSPGYVHWDCLPLSRLIIEAYATSEQEMISFLAPRDGDPPKRVRGGPSWVESELYNVEVRLSGDQSNLTGSASVAMVRQAMRPALRAMLEDRFQLKVRRLTEQFPIYALTIGPGGPNKDTFRAAVEGDCQPAPVPDASGRRPAPDNRPICGGGSGRGPEGRQRYQEAAARGTRLSEFSSFTTAMLAGHLSRSMDRQVMDSTGLDGKFNFALEYVMNGTMIGEVEGNRRLQELMATVRPPQAEKPAVKPPADGPTIFQAVGMLGLNLILATGPIDYFQVDSVQRPKPNEPAAEGPRARAQDAAPSSVPLEGEAQQQAPPQSRSAAPAAGQDKFDVVSIKPCPDVSVAQTGRGAGPNLAQTSPGHVFWACVTLASLVDQAYAGADLPLLNVQSRPIVLEGFRGEDWVGAAKKRVRGGPSWMFTERFTVEATAPVTVISPERGNLLRLPPAMNRALRAMIEDRFQLKLRREAEEVPLYALTIAPGGLKIKALTPDDCVVYAAGMPRFPPSGSKPYCGAINETTPLARLARLIAGENFAAVSATPGNDHRFEATGVTLQAVATRLAGMMDRFVIDKTGVAGEFVFAFEFQRNESTPNASIGISLPKEPAEAEAISARATAAGASREQTIFQALDGLGLRLDRITGPAEVPAD